MNNVFRQAIKIGRIDEGLEEVPTGPTKEEIHEDEVDRFILDISIEDPVVEIDPEKTPDWGVPFPTIKA